LPRGERSVEVTREGLVVDGTVVLARAAVASGVIHRDGPRVRVELDDGHDERVVLETTNLDVARAILRAMGVDGSQRTMTFRARSPVTNAYLPTVTGAILSLLLVLSIRVGPSGLVVALLVVLACLLITFAPPNVTVGRDAVVVRRLGRSRVIPLCTIHSL